MHTDTAKPSILRPFVVLLVLAALACLAALAAPLAAAEEDGVELGVTPAQPYDTEPVTLLFRIPLGSRCYSGEGLFYHGNRFDLELGSCPILPPPGPHVLEIDAAVGILEPGTYEVRYLFDGVVVETREFTVREALGTCLPQPTRLCLGDRRFEVRATWNATGQGGGEAQGAGITRDTGRLSFFSVGNVELVVKILDACALDGHFWVFAGGLTNVGVTLTVTDTTTGAVRTYQNPAGTAFMAIQDTTAFSCP